MCNIIVIGHVVRNSFSPKCLKLKAAIRGGIPPLRAA